MLCTPKPGTFLKADKPNSFFQHLLNNYFERMKQFYLLSVMINVISFTIAWDFNPTVNLPEEHDTVRQNPNINYTNILNFWKDHKEEFVFGKHKNVVLVMGNTGAGKTTIVSALTGRKLRAFKRNGYFSIADDEGRIGTGSSSKTLIPEAMYDRKRNVTYIDCSGFRDNRNVEYEISSIYFQNILMNQVEKIKLILVINYDSLKYTGNKNDFDDLFEHIGEFIKDFSKFHDGIGLIVTKVENTFEQSDDGLFYLSNTNELVLKGIAQYMEDKIEIYRNKTDNREKYRMFSNLIEILLEKKNDSYTRIAISRDPTREGLLEDSKIKRNEINGIAKMIIENLRYVEKERDDFGFALSKHSKNIVDQIVDDIFRYALTNRLHKLGNETLTHYLQMEAQYNDIKLIRDRITIAYDVISILSNIEEPLQLFQEFLNATNTLNISVALTNLNTISEDIRTLNFFTTVSDSNVDNQMMLLKIRALNIIGSIEKLKSYYEFLYYLQEHLASHTSQELRNDNRIENIMRSCIRSKCTTVKDIIDLEDVVKKIGSYENYRKIQKLELNQFQLNHLKAVFSYFTRELEYSCSASSEEMKVNGYNIRMSDVVKMDCWNKAKNIQIFALNKIFIDCTINKTGAEAQLFIYSPTWETIGWQKIILDGRAAEPHDNTSAKSSTSHLSHGEDGLPGLPGGPAGHFFGVGKLFLNPEHLEIHANGGDGGPGQDGGDGVDGIAGKELPESFFEKTLGDKDIKWIFQKEGLNYKFTRYATVPLLLYAARYYDGYVYGKPAKIPTNGGDGGVGGRGGYPGTIVINGLGKSVSVKTLNNTGFVGLGGRGGYGGKGTSNGKTVRFTYGGDYLFMFLNFNGAFSDIEWIDGAVVPAGKDGRPGLSQRYGEIYPSRISIARQYPAINFFKDLIRINLPKNTKASELRTLINNIENNSEIKAQYNTLAFVEEFEGLEGQFLELRNKIDFVEFYDSFLNRVEEFAISEQNLKNKKVLSFLYTAALTKVFTLRKKRKGKTVVNLLQYLNTIETRVKEIREAQHLQIVGNYRSDYEYILNNKIQEANKFIVNEIEPEINKLWEESDKQMQATIDEIQNNKKSKEKAIALLEKDRRMIRNLQLRSTLPLLKLITSSLNFFGPIGTVAAFAISGLSDIATGMRLDKASDQGKNRFISLDPNFMSRLTKDLNNKPDQLVEKLQEVVTKLEKLTTQTIEQIKDSENIRDLISQIDEVKNRKANRISEIEKKYEDAKNIANKLNAFLNSRKDILEKEREQLNLIKHEEKNVEQFDKESNIENSLRNINEAQSILNSAGIIFNVVEKLETNEEIIKHINNQISEYIDQIKGLEKMEDQVFDIIMPDLYQIENNVIEVMASVNGSSYATLDLTKWNVRKSLRDLKSLLQNFTHKMTFELQSNLVRFVEKLDEGFSILIDIYDRIDSYSDSVKQAEYIAHIMSAPMTDIQVTDPELNKAINDLKLNIQSNILFEKYGIALHAFKQHYFPFAAHVLHKFQLPENMQLNDTETLRSNIIKKIKDMENHINESESTIDEYSKFAHKNNVFNSNTPGSAPFYVWKHDTIRDEIVSLLNGSEILLKADISRGLNYNSVKYSDIGINFKLKNESLQNSLNSVLKNFELTMTMVGNNYYRCGERYYFISFDDVITISYTLNQDNEGNWINPNLVYTTIQNSHAFLSPYGLWSIKLRNIDKSVSFDNLNVYANENEGIDLELIGRGDYIEQNPHFNFNICNKCLDTFYNVENIIQELS